MPIQAQAAWLTEFVGDLAQTATNDNPNSVIKLELPVENMQKNVARVAGNSKK